MLRLTTLLVLLAATAFGCRKQADPINTQVNESSADRMLLVLTVPSITNVYYASNFNRILDFHVNYAKAIANNDNVVVIADAATMPYLVGRLPEEVLLTENVNDIWMRDFTTINPMAPVQFTYTWASMGKGASKRLQQNFSDFADRYNITRTTTDLILDGGNIVDNYAGNVITPPVSLKTTT